MFNFRKIGTNVRKIAPTLLFICLASACGKKEETQQMDAAVDPSAPMSEPMMAAKPQPSIEPEKVIIGVQICDDFLDRYRACYAQLPPGIKSSMKKGFEETEQALFKASKVENAEETLTEACFHLDESVSTSMRAQGCVW